MNSSHCVYVSVRDPYTVSSVVSLKAFPVYKSCSVPLYM